MNIQVAVLCDAATDESGKLNLLGAFDTIYTQQLPAIHPQCSVALRVTFFNGEEGKRSLRFNFVDADGRSIIQGSIQSIFPWTANLRRAYLSSSNSIRRRPPLRDSSVTRAQRGWSSA